MESITILLLVNLAFIWGFSSLFGEGMILEKVDRWINRTKEKDELKRILSRRKVKMTYLQAQRSDVGMMEQLISQQQKKEIEVDNSIAEVAQKELESLKPKIPLFLQKPLYSCPICGASIWGTLGYFTGTIYLFGWSWSLLAFWPVYCIALAGLSAIIINLSPESNG